MSDKISEAEAPEPEEQAVLDDAMVQLLVCPLTKQPLTYDEEASEFISKAAKLAYPVRGGVPILLPSEARSLDTPVSIPTKQEE
ncbi:MAG: Trm112 family protein [Pseudomonadota bacterium]